jgi:CheY-like chemotaxis protein
VAGGVARVLVVDDEEHIRALIGYTLERMGHTVEYATDGSEVLGLIEQSAPDLILLDVNMPGASGWEVLGQLRSLADPALASLPVVMVTAAASDVDRIRGGIEGATGYLVKPFSLAGLRTEVEEALSAGSDASSVKRSRIRALNALAELESRGPGEVERRRPPSASEPLRAFEAKAPEVVLPALWASALTPRQREMVDAVASSDTVAEAARRLGMAPSALHARMRSVAHRLGLPSASALISAARRQPFVGLDGTGGSPDATSLGESPWGVAASAGSAPARDAVVDPRLVAFDAAIEPCLVTDLDGRCLAANRAAVSLVGAETDGLIVRPVVGRVLSEAIVPADGRGLLAPGSARPGIVRAPGDGEVRILFSVALAGSGSAKRAVITLTSVDRIIEAMAAAARVSWPS